MLREIARAAKQHPIPKGMLRDQWGFHVNYRIIFPVKPDSLGGVY
jgi:hypothetical protein